jgi:DNA-binding LacI/PurR family transcriptional regulator
MKYESVTIKDIAKALGVSTSTVSRALRDSHEISTATKQMVLDVAEKLNYRPNPIALSLKERKTRSIGVIVCEIANSFFSQIINGIESVAYDKGYNVIISQTNESYEREVIDLQNMSSRAIDGLLISVSTETSDFTHINELHKRGLPIVFFDRIASDIKTHSVIIDNYKGAYEATEHLINAGYKNIAAIGNSEFLSITVDRMAGYKDALTANGIKIDKKLIKYCFYGGMIFSEVEDTVNQLLIQKKKPDAIITLSDKLTTGCLITFNRRGLRVPEDIAIVGFSNSDLTELTNPPLSVVKQPAFEMGRAATELILQIIESKRPITEFEKRIMSTEFIPRESSKKI